MADTMTVDGTRIDFSDTDAQMGDQPAVVLVHGITESRESWGPVVERLAPTHRVISLDLRGHGSSAKAERYDLEAMAGDVAAVLQATDASRPHLVGHSLGGAVVSAVGAAIDVSSIVNVDQSLRLGGFKENLMPVEGALKDPDSFGSVIEAIFADMSGTMLSNTEVDRISTLRRADQEVVLGVWELLFSMSANEIDAVVQGALAGYAGRTAPYLSLFGIDPGDDYERWLQGHIATASVELWDDHGHYPHLVDPDRFVGRLTAFWSA